VNIAIFGDSITAGAEVPNFRVDRSQAYAQQVISGLNARFPQSHVTETASPHERRLGQWGGRPSRNTSSIRTTQATASTCSLSRWDERLGQAEHGRVQRRR